MGSLPFGGGGDADEMDEDLESFEKACHCFWPFQCQSRCVWAHTRTMEVGETG